MKVQYIPSNSARGDAHVRNRARDILARFELRETGLPITRLRALELREFLLVSVMLRVRSLQDGEPLDLQFEESLSYLQMEHLAGPHLERVLTKIVQSLLRGAVLHELDECLAYAGQKVVDPHAQDGTRVPSAE